MPSSTCYMLALHCYDIMCHFFFSMVFLKSVSFPFSLAMGHMRASIPPRNIWMSVRLGHFLIINKFLTDGRLFNSSGSTTTLYSCLLALFPNSFLNNLLCTVSFGESFFFSLTDWSISCELLNLLARIDYNIPSPKHLQAIQRYLDISNPHSYPSLSSLSSLAKII